MTEPSHSTPRKNLLIHPGAFARALIPPIIMWGALVLLGNLGGQPGVVCITPMAWLLALWSGTQYAQIASGQSTRLPLLGPALLGCVLGLCLGVIFALGISPLSATAPDAEEVARYRGATAFVIIGSVLVCGLLCTFTAWLTQRRLAKVKIAIRRKSPYCKANIDKEEQRESWRQNIFLEDGHRTIPAQVQIHSHSGNGTCLRVILHQGRKR